MWHDTSHVIILLMKTLPCPITGKCKDAIAEAVQILREGGIVAHPTDTCYGLAVDITNKDALKQLYEVKGMPTEKPVSILVGSLEEAQKYGEFCDLALRLAEEFWPGPLTLVVPRKKALPGFMNPDAEEIGLRVIDNPVSEALIKGLGGPVTTTSANAHGRATPFSVKDITTKPDLVVDVGWLERHEKPSTVLLVKDDQATTLRQGDLFDLYLGSI